MKSYPAVDFVECTPDCVMADRTLLQHLLVNLVGNAATYVPPGERPSVTIRSFSGGDRGWVRLYVVDAGVGIAEGEQGRDLRAVSARLDRQGHLRGHRARARAVQAQRGTRHDDHLHPPLRLTRRPA